MTALLVLVGAYLLGSLPFSFLVARAWGISDVRRVGSGNVGATNVMRSAGRIPGILAMLLDAAKGAAAVLITGWAGGDAALQAGAATAAIVGHMFPVWLGFRGGKGVATGAGAFLILAPAAVAIALCAFLVSLATIRYVSVSSMIGASALALAAFLRGSPASVSAAALLNAVLIVVQHRSNIVRWRQGTENRLGSGRR